ncbi:hypothetical protein PAMA_007306 [Pampus argenteus]
MEQEAVQWWRFCVFVAGQTHGAHLDLVKKLKAIGQTEVTSPDECDYLLVICPAVSRVATNIQEALSQIPAQKPVILVVMHHTFDNAHVVAESRRLNNNPIVRLTVDCLFHGKDFHDCKHNYVAWCQIHKFLQEQKRWKRSPCNGSKSIWRWILAAALLVGLGAILTFFLVKELHKR